MATMGVSDDDDEINPVDYLPVIEFFTEQLNSIPPPNVTSPQSYTIPAAELFAEPLNAIPRAPSIDSALNVHEIILPSNTSAETTPENYFRHLDEALSRCHAPSPPHNIQQGGGNDEGEPASSSSSSSHDVSTQRRHHFNNVEIRRSFSVPPRDSPDLAQFYQDVMGILREMADTVRQEVHRGDVIQLEIRGENIQNHIQVDVNDDGDAILPAFEGLLERLVQSNLDVAADERLDLIAQVVHNPRGGNRTKLDHLLDSEVMAGKRRHLYVVGERKDQLCFAISLAHVIAPGCTDEEAEAEGERLQRLAGLSKDTPVNFSDISKFEGVVKRKIVVYYREKHHRHTRRYETGFTDRTNPLFLFLFQNHYYGVKNVTGLIGYSFICRYCYAAYHHPSKHRCDGYCLVCQSYSCAEQGFNPVFCPDCGRQCRTPACFSKHKEPRETAPSLGKRPLNAMRRSICDAVKQCSLCREVYEASERRGHKCREQACRICGEKLPFGFDLNNHVCYIQPLRPSPEHTDRIIFYDFETMLDERDTHLPYLVYTKTLKGEAWWSYGADCVEKFVHRFRRPAFRDSTFIAHNSKGFDSYLILNTLVKMGVEVSVIMQGSKVLCFTDPDFNLKYIDSLSFLPMPLRAFPKALGFPEQNKGRFPHGFSSPERLNYVGPYPPSREYGLDSMTACDRDAFLAWYRDASRGVFDFKKEALKYCRQDVDILAEGCVRFRDQFVKDTRVDPFSCITIASACIKVFRTNFLAAQTLAVPSPDDYRRQFKSFSHPCIQWLELISHTRDIFIQHARNRGEKKIGPYFVDGYAKIGSEEHAWEFLGCFFHGCPTCFDPRSVNPLLGVRYEELHFATQKKLQTLRSEYKVNTVALWEHEWTDMKKSDQRVKAFLQTSHFPEPLQPRDALFGGRTSAIRLRYTAGPNESVHYVDVTSLYPYVNCSYPYPLGHPVIIHRDFEAPQKYFGLIRAVVYPPRHLYFPVLPYKTSHGKLVFTLCRTCAELNHQAGPCRHTDEDRALTGVWVTVEFNKALEKGYRLARITEVWHFDARSDSIFQGYIHTFLKGKQEASGFPPEAAVSQESRARYVEDYRVHQGIRLDPDRIEINPAKRQVAKLCLNSFWGKFAQKSNQTQTALVSDPDKFFPYLFSDQYDVKYFSFLNDQVAMVQWGYNKRCLVLPGKTDNIFIAAFTTAYARLKLYGYLERVGENVLYIDTDSLIYVVKEGESPLELGNYLGDLTDELGGDTIDEFAAAGPKSYAYRTKNQK